MDIELQAFINSGHLLSPHQWWYLYRFHFGEDAHRFVKGLLKMAGIGKKFNFHGSFSSKAAAMKKEAETPGSFISERMVSGKTRYFVLTPKKGTK